MNRLLDKPEQPIDTHTHKRIGKIKIPNKSNFVIESLTETEGDGVSVKPVLYTHLRKE